MKPTGKDRRTILVVNRDPAVLLLLQKLLATADCRVLLAGAKGPAIRLMRQHHIRLDLILLDVHVPGITGQEMQDEIMSIRPGIPLLLISAFVDGEFIRVKVRGRAGLLEAVRQALEVRPKTMTAARA